MTKPTVTAEAIIALLRARHADDVFVAECKNGPTHYPVNGLLKLDAWVMPKSWAHWATIGYEVKVSRADFEQDQKWIRYLPLCHLFYFVCPAGLIRAADLPKGVGLMWVSTNGERLHVKVRAECHEPDRELLQMLMAYVLMARCRIDPERDPMPAVDHHAMLRQWTADAERKGDLAHFVRGHVRARVEAANQRAAEAEKLAQHADNFARRLAKLGIIWDTAKDEWYERSRIDREIEKLVGALDWRELAAIEHGGKAALEFVATVRRLREETEKAADAAKGG